MPPQDPETAQWFAAHVQPHEAMLRAWLRSRFRSENDVDEVVQETWLGVIKGIDRFEGRSSFKTWLFTIVSRRIADQFRKRRQAGPTMEPLPDDDENAPLESIADPASMLPDAGWEAEWEQNLIAAATDRVKRHVKGALFQMYDYHVLQGHSASETAEHLHTNAASVYVAKHRVGRMLKQQLKRLREELR